MTLPDLPPEGSIDWYDHYAALDAQARAATATYRSKRPHPLTDPPVDYMRPQVSLPNGNTPMFTLADTGLSSILWPYIVKVKDKTPSAPKMFAAVYGTDHDSGQGALGIAWGDTPLGPWEIPNPGQSIFTDTVAGAQTETPSIIWNPETSLWHLYYQQSYGTYQTTQVATSPDFATWTRVGAAIVNLPSNVAGYNHTGYFKPCRVGRLWFGYHLLGGGDFGAQGISYSNDGLLWRTDPRRLMAELDAGSTDRRVNWHGLAPFMWRGEMWATGALTEFVSGVTTGITEVYVAKLARSLRAFEEPPMVLTGLGATQEPTNFVEHDGDLYGLYRTGTAHDPTSGFAAMKVAA